MKFGIFDHMDRGPRLALRALREPGARGTGLWALWLSCLPCRRASLDAAPQWLGPLRPARKQVEKAKLDPDVNWSTDPKVRR